MIGTVTSLVGSATIRSADGVSRALKWVTTFRKVT